VYEQASLTIHPLPPPATYWYQVGQDYETLTPGPPPPDLSSTTPGSPAPSEPRVPLLVVRGSGAQAHLLSVLFLASADGGAAPDTAARGVLLLSPDEIIRLTSPGITLDEYIHSGGYILLRDPLPGRLPLEPYLHVRLLAELLHHHPNLGAA